MKTAVLGSIALGCGEFPGEMPQGSETEHVSEISDEIINGSVASVNYFAVAVYHRDGGVWAQRPCTGTLVATVGQFAYVLTAYHCVNTTSGPTDLRVTSLLSPGRLTGSPPSTNWIVPLEVFIPSGASDQIVAKDYALIKVINSAALKAGITATDSWDFPAFYFGAATNFFDRPLRAYGYGRSTECTSANDAPGGAVDCLVEDPGSGVGVLRLASGLTGTSTGGAGWYRYNMGASKVYSGDSGGPSTTFISYATPAPHPDEDDYSWRIFTGVHVDVQRFANPTYGNDASSPTVPEFIQTHIGRTFISSVYRPNNFVRRHSTSSGSGVSAIGTATDAQAQWLYSSTTKQIKTVSGNLCLQGASGLNTSISAVTCSSSTSQKWTHTRDLQLKNDSSGMCAGISASSNLLSTTCAVRADQAWVFRFETDQL